MTPEKFGLIESRIWFKRCALYSTFSRVTKIIILYLYLLHSMFYVQLRTQTILTSRPPIEKSWDVTVREIISVSFLTTYSENSISGLLKKKWPAEGSGDCQVASYFQEPPMSVVTPGHTGSHFHYQFTTLFACDSMCTAPRSKKQSRGLKNIIWLHDYIISCLYICLGE